MLAKNSSHNFGAKPNLSIHVVQKKSGWRIQYDGVAVHAESFKSRSEAVAAAVKIAGKFNAEIIVMESN